MKLLKRLFLVLALCWSTAAMADSPLTSTYFANVYKDVNIVQKAIQANGQLTLEIMDYLAEPENPVDIKVAAINAIGWGNECNNYTMFLDFLKKKYNVTSEITLLYALDPTTLISLAYVRALHDYFDVGEANIIAFIAQGKRSNSLTINLIYALIFSQLAMDIDWGVIYPACYNVVMDENSVRDIRPQAVAQIMEYINSYAEDSQETYQ
ncbi:MAG: hypothetical protein IKV19_00280 [Bacteroidaceae bacterium]|nr:hypothetical protein [Bacteroidaceae bacterium]